MTSTPTATTTATRLVASTAMAAAKATRERDAAIWAAVEAGESLRVVGAAAGLSHQRVHQIAAKGRRAAS